METFEKYAVAWGVFFCQFGIGANVQSVGGNSFAE